MRSAYTCDYCGRTYACSTEAMACEAVCAQRRAAMDRAVVVAASEAAQARKKAAAKVKEKRTRKQKTKTGVMMLVRSHRQCNQGGGDIWQPRDTEYRMCQRCRARIAKRDDTVYGCYYD
jgi:hypothetical protein